jgi:phosphoserine aminotransferase
MFSSEIFALKKPERPFFCSGPCVKPKEWAIHELKNFLMGRSHRSSRALQDIQKIIDDLRSLLNIPETHRIILTPGSATGAMEMAMWNMLGARPVDVFVWDVFSSIWAHNVEQEMRLQSFVHRDEPLQLLQKSHPDHDLILTWTGSTHGIWAGSSAHWLASKKSARGLIICDAAAAVFTTILPWDQLDVSIFSWQKALGGEASTGIMVMSPKALAQLENHTPHWPIPRLFRLKKNDQVMQGIFRGELINTPSLLCLQENSYLLDLWRQRGGIDHGIARTQHNFSLVQSYCQEQDWLDFLVSDPLYRAQGPVCLRIKDKKFQALPQSEQWKFLHHMGDFLAYHEAAFECVNHILSVPSLRIWCGPSVEPDDLIDLFPWLSLAFRIAYKEFFPH